MASRPWSNDDPLGHLRSVFAQMAAEGYKPYLESFDLGGDFSGGRSPYVMYELNTRIRFVPDLNHPRWSGAKPQSDVTIVSPTQLPAAIDLLEAPPSA